MTRNGQRRRYDDSDHSTDDPCRERLATATSSPTRTQGLDRKEAVIRAIAKIWSWSSSCLFCSSLVLLQGLHAVLTSQFSSCRPPVYFKPPEANLQCYADCHRMPLKLWFLSRPPWVASSHRIFQAAIWRLAALTPCVVAAVPQLLWVPDAISS